MSRLNLEDGLAAALLNTRVKMLVQTQTLGANLTLDAAAPPVHFLDPGGAARDVTLPAEASSENLVFVIINTADAAETITVKNDGGGTVVTIAQNKGGIVFCDGTTWKGLVGGNT